MTTGEVFDVVARDYDAAFTEQRLGRHLRERVNRRLDAAFAPGDHVLDLGCGTGEDAVRLARRGLRVTAVDGSAAMLAVARDKAAQRDAAHRITYRRADLAALSDALAEDGPEAGFDGAYSNFGALNCIADRAALAGALARIVRPGGRLVLVVMGLFCAWETLGNLARGRPGIAFRRWSRRPTARLRGEQEPFRVWYPSVRRVRRDFDPWFRLLDAGGVGLFLPPTELGALVDRHPRLLRALAAGERRFGDLSAAAWLADHHVTVFERR